MKYSIGLHIYLKSVKPLHYPKTCIFDEFDKEQKENQSNQLLRRETNLFHDAHHYPKRQEKKKKKNKGFAAFTRAF